MDGIERLIHTDWITFPCQKKVPAVKRWPALVRTVPHDYCSGYGILCGARNRLIVIDCDILKPEKDDATKLMCGVHAWTVLEQQFPELSRAPRVRTRSGGLHVYFEYTPRLKGSIQQVSGRFWGEADKHVKIDVLSDGRFAIGPGSDGYAFVGDSATRPLAVLPDHLIRILSVDRPSVDEGRTAGQLHSNPATILTDEDGTRLVMRTRDRGRCVSKSELRRCLQRVPDTAAADYHRWLKVVWSIADTARRNGYDALDLAIQFSQRCPQKFKSEQDVRNVYERSDGRCTYATLKYLSAYA